MYGGLLSQRTLNERYAKSCTHYCEGKDHYRCDWTSWPPEEEKWSRVHIDYAGPFFDGCYMLVLVDAYSRWAEAHTMKSTTKLDTIMRLRQTFSQEGVPNVIVSDNGPQFACINSGIGYRELGTTCYTHHHTIHDQMV